MNNTLSLSNELNSLILPAVSVFFQIVLALVLFCIKRLEQHNYIKLNQMQESILDSVSKVGNLSTSRQEAQNASPQEPYQESDITPTPTHRDIQLNDNYIIRIKK